MAPMSGRPCTSYWRDGIPIAVTCRSRTCQHTEAFPRLSHRRPDSQILGWRLSGLVYRASTQVKGQLPVLLGLVCAVAFPHLRLNAGGNDLAQLKTVVTGVVTTSEKYAISRSEHTTAASLIITHHQQGTVQIQDLQILRGPNHRCSILLKPWKNCLIMVCVKAIDVCSAVKTDIVFLSRRAHLDPYELVEKWLYRTCHD